MSRKRRKSENEKCKKKKEKKELAPRHCLTSEIFSHKLHAHTRWTCNIGCIGTISELSYIPSFQLIKPTRDRPCSIPELFKSVITEQASRAALHCRCTCFRRQLQISSLRLASRSPYCHSALSLSAYTHIPKFNYFQRGYLPKLPISP